MVGIVTSKTVTVAVQEAVPPRLSKTVRVTGVSPTVNGPAGLSTRLVRLREHAAKRLSPNHLLVLLNDFVDNCMVETAGMVTEQRAARE